MRDPAYRAIKGTDIHVYLIPKAFFGIYTGLSCDWVSGFVIERDRVLV